MRSQIIKIATLALAFVAILTACGKKTTVPRPDSFTAEGSLEVEVDNGTIVISDDDTTDTFEIIYYESDRLDETSDGDVYVPDDAETLPDGEQTTSDDGQNAPETTAKKTEESKPAKEPAKETEKPSKNEDPCKAGHKYSSWTTVIEATCKREGELSRVCSVCNHEETKTVDKSGHNLVTVPGKSATCAKEGLTDGTKCADCDKVVTKQEKIAKISHSFGNWTTTTKPTCAAEGEETRKCVNCNAVERNPIEKNNDHDYYIGVCKICSHVSEGSSFLKYRLSDDGTYYVCIGTSVYTSKSQIIIPSYYNGKPVKEIKAGGSTGTGFCNTSELIIMEGIERIAEQSFFLNDIQTVYLPDSLKYIGGAAFDYCANLDYVYVDTIGWKRYDYADRVEDANIDLSDPHQAAVYLRDKFSSPYVYLQR